jgi:steroid 5-alpha reductase family enzyme
MLNGSALSAAYAAMAVFALAGWLLSLVKRDVSIVDSLWSLFFLLGLGVYVAASAQSPRTSLLIALVSVWALRLSIYLTWRNWGEPEDHRYQVIRARNEPNFSVKSVYLIFGFQVVLAGIIAFPLFTAASSAAPLGPLDWVGVALWSLGMFFEVVGDWQLARFKSNPAQKGRVLNTGLWRYTRHPNYFGETALWWGYYAMALSAGAWWTIFAPLLMTLLLLKVSGVALLEKDIGERRPAYADYVRRTNAFLPWLPKDAS